MYFADEEMEKGRKRREKERNERRLAMVKKSEEWCGKTITAHNVRR